MKRVFALDEAGTLAEMAPNENGNFFQHAPLAPPLRAWIVGEDGMSRSMVAVSPTGSCNTCHRIGGASAPLAAP